MTDHYNDREYTEFLDRIRDRARKNNRLVERNRWVEPISVTREKAYDRETERLRSQMNTNRKAAA